jgi:hypothetical protein
VSGIAVMTAELIESVPARLRPGVLYVSQKYATAAHLSCCGCGQEVFTPLSPAQWRLTLDSDGRPSLHPSVGKWALPCQSHYLIRRGAVHRARTYDETEIARNRDVDRRLLAAQLDAARRPHFVKRPWRRIFG